jgi:hypothetical protein
LANSAVPQSRLSRYSSLLMMALGIVTILFVSILGGIALTLVGLGMHFFYRRVQRRAMKTVEASRRKGGAEPEAKHGMAIEKETQAAVKIPCKFCGSLNDPLRTKCESCGAPMV